MFKINANQSLALFSLIAGLGISISSNAAEDNLRLPYDQPSADFIAPQDNNDAHSPKRDQTRNDPRLLPVAPPTQDELRNEGSRRQQQPSQQQPQQVQQQEQQQNQQQPSQYYQDPRQSAPVAQADNREFLRGNAQLSGQECRGLQNGQYSQMYSLYTLIYKYEGKIFIEYPVFTLRAETQYSDRRDPRQDTRPVYQGSGQQGQVPQQLGGYNNQPNYGNQQFSQGQGNEPDLYAQFRGPGPLTQGNFTGGQQQMPAQVSQNVGQQALDPWGRPMFDAYGRPLMQQQLLSLQMQQIQQQQQQQQYQQQSAQHQQMAPAMPQQQFAANQAQNDCVVLPYLRRIELEGAVSIENALEFLQQTPSDITPDATVGFSDSPTPRQFGEQAARDPQLKTK